MTSYIDTLPDKIFERVTKPKNNIIHLLGFVKLSLLLCLQIFLLLSPRDLRTAFGVCEKWKLIITKCFLESSVPRLKLFVHKQIVHKFGLLM